MADTVPAPGTTKHHKIVALEGFITPIPDFTSIMPPGHTYTLLHHESTAHDDEVIKPRLAEADIALVTVLPLSAAVLSPAVSPNLKFISVMASGYDVINLATCKERGIVVSNSPACNVDAVGEHSIGLYFSVRRSIGLTQSLLRAGEWTKRPITDAMNSPGGKGTLPMKDEVVGILGHGGVGKKIAALCRGLGMKTILAAGRKGQEPPEGRTSFEEVIRTATVLFLCLPRMPETMGLISEPEFRAMQSHAVLVNVSRGGVVDEEALVAALKAGEIAGAAVDVFATEPAGPENSVLLREDTEGLNLVTTPHAAWVSRETTKNYQDTLVANLKAFLNGKPQNVVS